MAFEMTAPDKWVQRIIPLRNGNTSQHERKVEDVSKMHRGLLYNREEKLEHRNKRLAELKAATTIA